MMTTLTMSQPDTRTSEQTLSFATLPLFGTAIGIPAVLCGIWVLVTSLLAVDTTVVYAAPLAAIAVSSVGAVSVLAMTPWKIRSISEWTTMWLIATVIRLFLTPAMAFLLYSATSTDGVAFTIAVGVMYFLAILAEVAVVARRINRATPTLQE